MPRVAAVARRARRVASVAVLVLLAGVSGAMVWLEARSVGPLPPSRNTSTTDPRTAAVTVTPDGRAWRALTETLCSSGSVAGGSGSGRAVVDRRAAGAAGSANEWTPVETPLAEIRRLSAAQDGSLVVAQGTDGRCSPRYVFSLDGGFTWNQQPDLRDTSGGPVEAEVVDTSSGTDAALWMLVQPSVGPALVAVGRPVEKAPSEPDAALLTLGPARPVPCPLAGGPAAFVAALNGQQATVLCQAASPFTQALIRTSDAGVSWSAVEGSGPSFGSSPDVVLDAAVTAIGSLDPARLWALVDGLGVCVAGELRTSQDAGTTWTTVGCLGQLARVDRTLAVALARGGQGVLIGIRQGEVVTLTSATGGRTWQ